MYIYLYIYLLSLGIKAERRGHLPFLPKRTSRHLFKNGLLEVNV